MSRSKKSSKTGSVGRRRRLAVVNCMEGDGAQVSGTLRACAGQKRNKRRPGEFELVTKPPA